MFILWSAGFIWVSGLLATYTLFSSLRVKIYTN